MADYSFQEAAIGQVMDALETNQRVLLQAPTGAGKTRMAMEIAKRSPKPVLFLAEAREIVRQSVDAFRAQGMPTTALTADSITGKTVPMLATPYVVAAQRTAWSRGVNKGHNLGTFQTIIVDEAHHVRARTYEELLDLWPEAKVVLLTATPVRGDGKGLGNVATAMVQGGDYGGNYSDLIASGVLVPSPKHLCWSWPAQLSGVRKQAGDYAMGGAKGASKVMDTPKLVGDVVEHWLKHAEDRQTIVYATSVAHAQHLEAGFNNKGIIAETVHAETPKDEREGILDSLKDGLVQVVTNFGVLTEGFDCPSVSCIVLCRPTKLIGLYIQMVGRGLRQAPGKDNLLLLDHTGIVLEHGMPGTDMHWKLTETKDAVEGVKGEQACPECGQLLIMPSVCYSCGWRKNPKRGQNGIKDLDDVDDSRHDVATNLVRLSDQQAAKVEADMKSNERQTFQALVARAKRYGKRVGWAAWKYRERYGVWPPGAWSLPDPRTMSSEEWLRYARDYAADRGYKPGWANIQFKEMYGRWPSDSARPRKGA